MTHVSRRSFLASSATAAAAAGSLLPSAQATEVIPGFDQTKTDIDQSRAWEPYSDRKVRLGIVGHGACKFGLEFDLQHHPNVELVAVSDLFPDRCADMAQKAKCDKTYPSLEEMIKDDSIEAIYCATDAPAHAKHAILCMDHGKHVATAVPAFRGDIEDAEKLLECCKKNKGLIYAMFETSVFRDDLYAMEKLFAAGVFGRIVYSEGEYCHPHTVGAPSLGSYKNWRKNGCPMWYPTHATAYYVGVTHQPLVEVLSQGTPYFDESKRVPNAIGNIFKSEVGMFRTAEGGLSRKGGRNIDARAQFFYFATVNTPAMTWKLIGKGSQYAWGYLDVNGDYLDGSKTYKLNLPKDAPAKQFISVVLYDPQTRSELQTGQPFPSYNNQKHKDIFEANEDGSVDLYFGPKAPAGKESNWLQTVPKKGWFCILRLYSPTEPWFEKTWRPGDIELIK